MRLLLNTAQTQTRKHRGCYKKQPELEAVGSVVQLLHLLSCVPWLRGCCFRIFEEVWAYVVLPPAQHPLIPQTRRTNCTAPFFENTSLLLFPRWTGCTTHAYAQKHRPWSSQREELDVRPPLYRGCHRVESLRALGTVRYRYDTAANRGRKAEIVGFPWSCTTRPGGTRSLEKRASLRHFGRLEHAHGRGPSLRRSVPAGPLRAPQPRAQKTVRRRRACKYSVYKYT